MRRQPDLFDAMEHMSDEEAKNFVYGTKADRIEGLLGAVFLVGSLGFAFWGFVTVVF